MAKMTFAVLGDGPADRDNIADLLSDWLGFGQPDENGYFERSGLRFKNIDLILPLTDELFTAGVKRVHAWSARADVNYVGVIDDSIPPDRRDVRGAKGEASDLVPTGSVQREIVDLLDKAQREAMPGDQVFLLVLLDPAEAPEDPLREAIEGAWEEGIQVLNLSLGLAPMAPPRPASAGRTAKPGENESAGQSSPVTIDSTSTVEVDLTLPLEGSEEDVTAFLFDTLDTLVSYHNALDEATRLHNTGQGHGPMSPLTSRLIQATVCAQRLLNRPGPITLKPAPTEPAASAKPSRGKAAKVRKEWLNPDTGKWEPVGRGRPRRDVQIREVTVEE